MLGYELPVVIVASIVSQVIPQRVLVRHFCHFIRYPSLDVVMHNVCLSVMLDIAIIVARRSFMHNIHQMWLILLLGRYLDRQCGNIFPGNSRDRVATVADF